MSMEAAYQMQKRRRMARGGRVCAAHGADLCQECYADGGAVEEEESSGYGEMPDAEEKDNAWASQQDERDLNEHGADEIGAYGSEDDNGPQRDEYIAHDVENQSYPEELLERILEKLGGEPGQAYSEGGQVSNDVDEELAGSKPNEFDDLVLRDDLEFNYTGENSGDELGNEQLDEDERDLVARIMRSRGKQGRNPSPA